MESHDIVLAVAVVCVAVLGVVYIMNGGDGVALTGATATIAGLLGFKLGEGKKTNDSQE